MKHRSIWKIPALVVLVLLAGWTWALAQTQEFSADQILLGPGGEQQTRLYCKADRWRVDATQQGKKMIQIFRLDRKVAWMVIPEDKIYIESPLSADAPPWGETVPGEIERKALGEEAVDDHPALKYQVKTSDGEFAHEILVWISKELQVPVKTTSLDGRWGSTLKNIQIGPQPDDLFEVPAGFKQISPPLVR